MPPLPSNVTCGGNCHVAHCCKNPNPYNTLVGMHICIAYTCPDSKSPVNKEMRYVENGGLGKIGAANPESSGIFTQATVFTAIPSGACGCPTPRQNPVFPHNPAPGSGSNLSLSSDRKKVPIQRTTLSPSRSPLSSTQKSPELDLDVRVQKRAT